jgi:hypothetical protein
MFDIFSLKNFVNTPPFAGHGETHFYSDSGVKVTKNPDSN